MDYFSLVKTHPELFSDGDVPLHIILDEESIRAWEKTKTTQLKTDGLPLEWGKIGVVMDDPYNLILRDLVRFPDGDVRGYGRAVATAALKGGKGVVVMPEYQGKFLLIHIYRHPTRQWHYEFPRGFGEPHTSAVDNAHKEIDEEIGGKIAELVDLGEFHNNTGFEYKSVNLFLARLSSIGAGNEVEGIAGFVWLTLPELEEWIASERITDGFTIAAYTKAKLKRLLV
jgi:ADP-ribose pyrophosphatase